MMAIRMFEYDFAIALESRRRLGRKFYVEFPRSCVIYLRSTKNTPDVEEVEAAASGWAGVCISCSDGEGGALYKG